jgi:predicted secreted protein
MDANVIKGEIKMKDLGERSKTPWTTALLIMVLLVSLGGLTSAASPAATSPAEIQVTERENGQAVDLSGEVLVLNLESNPSTGYGWQVQGLDARILRQLDATEWVPDTPGKLGGPGAEVLRFAATGRGRATLNLVYARPWETAAVPAKSFSLEVNVAEPSRNMSYPQPVVQEPLEQVIGGESLDALPSAYDGCPSGGCTPVRDQGQCGSCWAFGTVGPLEQAILIRDGASKDLAEQYLVSCNTDGWGCDGGWWAHDYHEWKYPAGEPGPGAVYEADSPYTATDAPCNGPYTHHETIADWVFIAGESSVPSTDALKQAIYDYGPVSAAVCVNSAFQAYTGGVFNPPGWCLSINHAITLVGWDDSLGAWRLRNSWGPDWGEDGYMWIAYGKNYVGYSANYVVYEGSTPPTPPTAPTGLQATAVSTSQINLTWTDNADDEDGFKIESCAGEGCIDFGLIATVGANVTSLQDTGLAASTPYYYRVYAYNAAGNSAYDEANATTSDDTTAPDPPADLVATGRDGAVDLVWTANSESDLAGYTVYRSTTSGEGYMPLTGSLLSNPSYTDSSVSNGTTYYYVVTATDTSDNESSTSGEEAATPQVQVIVDVASADYATTYGTVSGTYLATQTQDDSYQSLTEVHSGGKPSLRYDQVEHIWSFELSGGNHVFNVDAYYDDAGDLESGFDLSWSTSPTGSWTPLLTVDKTADNDVYQSEDLGSVSGTIYIRAVDNDRTEGNASYDTLYVDHMYIDGGALPTEKPEPATNPDPANGASNVTTTPTLSWAAGAGAESHDVYFGTSSPPASQGNQTATSFSPGDLALDTTYYWRIDEVNDLGTTSGDVWSFTTQASSGPSTMHVHSIVLDTVKGSPPTVRGRATVIVVDNLGGFVEAATVYGTFTGSFSEALPGTTDAGGTVTLTTTEAIKKPAFTFCVDDITHADLTYEPGGNVMNCASYP